jgi:L,D-peptidoglycan transpeptidase YkuD (ErfK/YbiS/YcfS/YnhG family)
MGGRTSLLSGVHMISHLTFVPPNLRCGQFYYRCSFGKGGIKQDKMEGDGATPRGIFPLREIFYRSDRLKKPKTQLKATPLHPDFGWCDDPTDPMYNQFVPLPYPGRHEILWREDHVYDLILVVGYNDDPIVPYKGSAIFIHLAREDYQPTEGCIALSLPDLLSILAQINPTTKLVIP